MVDDDPDMRALLRIDLKRQGYTILEAADGHAAYDMILSTTGIDLVVTDIIMPEGDGIELIDRVQGLCPKCPPIVVVTGCTDLTVKELADHGAKATFYKPYDRSGLHSAIRSLLAG